MAGLVGESQIGFDKYISYSHCDNSVEVETFFIVSWLSINYSDNSEFHRRSTRGHVVHRLQKINKILG